MGPAIAVEVMVDELRAVVGIDPTQGKRHCLPQVLEPLLDMVLTLAHDRARLHPGRVNVGHVERMQKLAVGAVAGMRDQVDLGEARHLDVPSVRLRTSLLQFEKPAIASPSSTPWEREFSRHGPSLGVLGSSRGGCPSRSSSDVSTRRRPAWGSRACFPTNGQ